MASRAEEKQKRREERQRAEQHSAARERRQRLVMVASAAVFLAVIAVVVAIVVSQSGSDSGGGSTDISGVETVNSELAGLPQNGSVLGDPSAPKTLIEFGDLQCPVCKLYSEKVLPKFFSGVVKAGKVKVDFRPWTIIGPDSDPAAEAAYAAGEQGRFWSFVELFYQNQGTEKSGYVTDEFLTAVAKGAGVKDIKKWDQDRKDPRWKKMLAANDKQASGLGFTGTPSFAVQAAGGPVKPISVAGQATSPSAIAAAIGQG